MRNAHFAMAIHALALLAQSDEGYSSAYIAGSVNTGAPFLRRVLSTLVKAGLIEAREGRDGGYRLARPADRITLAEVYRATTGDPVLGPSPAEPNVFCPVGSGMRQAFGGLSAEIEATVLAALADRTVAQVSADAVRHGITGGRHAKEGAEQGR
ncbi:MAG TPA: Rrf2 family transcriptional regulator [Thermomicrobiales bacterium]|jgi:Rrf2 family protein|nr:Rrf2 family transcriptional regulator [Thermomicrobiales bacterium]